MSPVEFVLLSTLALDVILGVAVYFTNHRRVVNQYYLLLATMIALWQLSCWRILNADTIHVAVFAIRMASLFATTFPVGCHLLRLAIKFPNKNFFSILVKAWPFILINIFAVILCYTKFFLKSAILPENDVLHNTLVEPVYGDGQILYALYYIISAFFLIFLLRRDMRLLRGAQRSELAFVVFGAAVALLIGLVFSILMPLITGSSRYVPFSNAISIIALTVGIAYGIATHRILGIATILRNIISYLLAGLYLIGLYLFIWSLGNFILAKFSINSSLFAQLIAVLAVAFSMAPAHGKLQLVVNRVITSHTMDMPATMKKAGKIFQTITTIDALLSHFTSLLETELETDGIKILFPESDCFILRYPSNCKNSQLQIPQTSPIIQMIKSTKEPVCRDTLGRIRRTPLVIAVEKQLQEIETTLAVGIFSASGLSGLILFGSRRSGRIYDRNEQDALQILANQFAVALENANLYTQMQDSKIRNEILLDQLVSGVIAVNAEREIALFNREAQRITGLSGSRMIGLHIDVLPAPVCNALEKTLETQHELRNYNATLSLEGKDPIAVQMGTAYLVGHDKKPMGALLVINDLTEIKKLEEQVRRADQLASVGTLAAGMAHEIKNPLVTIKTFTQLLPRRFDDAEFRDTFSSLVEREVTRIDGIVNQLLSFSKPIKPTLCPMHLHETLEHTLKLVQEQLRQKNITLVNRCQAETDLISGDADLLTQAFINLHLNAIDAMDCGGTLTVTTSNIFYHFNNNHVPNNKSFPSPCIKVNIHDTGAGIPRDRLNRIFDPFYTSKSNGTGMGLSVSHGIFQEHLGVIDVNSVVGKGTVFTIYLPLLNKEEGK